MRRLFLTFLFCLAGFSATAQTCSQDRLSIRGDWGKAAFAVEIADTAKSRARGLMFRQSMPRFSGMLFVFDRPQRAVFWMKDTPLPLDMIFADKTGVVRHLREDAIPGSLEAIDGGSDILTVLELNAGLVKSLGIDIGSQIQHPAFGADAAWPCDG